MYSIDYDIFSKTFLDKNGKFSHKQSKQFSMFPYTGSSGDKAVESFDNILGAFLRMLYSYGSPETIDRNSIIESICEEVECTDDSITDFKSIVRDLYFLNDTTLRCSGFKMFMYTLSSKNDQKISEYLVRTICDVGQMKKVLDENQTKNNILDSLIEAHLPKLEPKKNDVIYIPLIPEIKERFTKDFIFLIKDKNANYNDVISLISYYYFFYTSQVILYINKFGRSKATITPVFFCTEWEKTSVSRECFNRGWKQIDSKLKTMFSHAVLLEMLNQTSNTDLKFTYADLLNIYDDSSCDEKEQIFSEVLKLKYNYTTLYVEEDGFTFDKDNYEAGNLESLLRGFFNDIIKQFESTSRNRANDAYKNSFQSFCKNNVLKRCGRCGNMLVLTEELLVLLTKVSIGNRKQIRLNELFDEFNKRGVFIDRQTQECVVDFYEKLNLIEKKSDSGDAQYVKGIL